MNKIVLPKLGQTMEEGTLEKWHVSAGDTVASGDVIAEITTDKATLEVQCFHDGTIRKILVEEGATVPVNTLIAVVGDPDEEIPEAFLEAAPEPVKVEAAAPAAGDRAPSATVAAALPARPAGRVFASPRAKKCAKAEEIPLAVLSGSGPKGRIVESDVLSYRDKRAVIRFTPTARQLAYERGVDLLSIIGTATDGRITKEDVEAAPAAVPAGAAFIGRREELTAMRRIVAERMSQSKREIPHYYLTIDIDMTDTVALRAALNASGEVRISFNDFLSKAVAIAAKDVPEVNAVWDGNAILYKSAFNVGIAVGLDEGLIVPVVRDADRKSLRQIAAESADLIARARSKKLTPDQYEGGSLTITNLGMFGVETFSPVINPGESVILGVGSISDQVVVIGGGIHVRKIMKVTLSGDHRVIDGARGAMFLKRVKELLADPEALAK